MDPKNIKQALFRKRGAPSWKEDKLLRPLMKHFEEQLKTNPQALDGIHAAASWDELKALHDKYCIEEAEVLSYTPNPEEGAKDVSNPEQEAADKEAADAASQSKEATHGFENNEVPVDPMNRQTAHVRDYVLDPAPIDNPDQAKDRPQAGGTPDLREPSSFSEAFKLPEGFGEKDNKGQDKTGQQGGNGQSGPSQPKKEREPAFNPAFDDMSGAKKLKQTRRFAKRITSLVCNLLEHGYVYWVTKDITEAKLVEYELNDEMDLNLLISLDGVQEQTVKAFFQRMCADAKKDSKISDDDREELADALAEVMMEKGIAPTPMQNLLVVGGEIIIAKAIPAIAASAQINSLLNELRKMKQGPVEEQDGNVYESQEQPVQQQQAQRPAHPSQTVDTFGQDKNEVSMEISALTDSD